MFSENTKKYFSWNTLLYFLLFCASLLWLYRIYWFLESQVPLGYDPGLYRMMFSEYIANLPHVDFQNLGFRNKSAYPPFLWLFWNILHIIWFSVDFLLSYGIWFFSLITSIYLYLFAKQAYWKNVAIIAMIIFFISIVQYHSFWLNYYKQIIGIIFMLSAFYTLENKKYLISFPLIISIFTIHRPTWVYFLATYLLYKLISFIISKDKRNMFDLVVIFSSGIIALFMYLPFLHTLLLEHIKPLTQTILWEWASGTFFSKENFWNYNMVIIIASLFWFYLKLKRREFDLLTIGYITGMIWVWFRLFFFSRMFIFFDIFIILMAAFAFGSLYKKNIKIFTGCFIIFFLLQSSLYLTYIHVKWEALVSEKELDFIKELPTIVEKDAIIMVWSSHYSPWIAGYVTAETLAPWLFHLNVWNKKDWEIWWKSDWSVKCRMLQASFSQDTHPDYLWIWERQHQENISNGSCFEPVAEKENSKLLKINLNHETSTQ